VDIQAYISSGKLELFVLGELSERESEEVIRLAKKYPEIQAELDQIEEAFFDFDNQTGKAPSAKVKNRVFESLEKDFEIGAATAVGKSSPTKVVAITPWKSYFAAACVTTVIASVAAIFFAMQYKDVDNRFTALLQEQSQLAEQLDQYKVNFEETDAQLESLLAGDFQRIPMKGDPFEIQKDAVVDVWWDQAAASVFISVNRLEGLDENQDYQLWAIGDDGPVGIGLINPGQKFSLQQMDAVAAAGTFAVTIEPKGGSESPTLEKLVVIGNVG
jgi:anti-sigma-K factor RskA